MQPALITTRAELDRALETSREKPVLIFKHSLTCPISTAAWEAYRDHLASLPPGEEVLYTLIEIQNARDISCEVAERTGVKHESPQALLVKDGEVVWNANHWDISAEALAAAVA